MLVGCGARSELTDDRGVLDGAAADVIIGAPATCLPAGTIYESSLTSCHEALVCPTSSNQFDEYYINCTCEACDCATSSGGTYKTIPVDSCPCKLFSTSPPSVHQEVVPVSIVEACGLSMAP